MLKSIALAAVLALATSVSAMAEPGSADDCFKMSADLFKTADAKKLGDTDRTKVEEMLEKMETHCDAKQFSDAQTVADGVKAMVK